MSTKNTKIKRKVDKLIHYYSEGPGVVSISGGASPSEDALSLALGNVTTPVKDIVATGIQNTTSPIQVGQPGFWSRVGSNASNMLPGVKTASFAAGYGTARLKDKFDRTVMKKDAGKRNSNITGGFFNFGLTNKGKNQKRELNYLNNRLQRNILSKFMSFNGNDEEYLDYNKISDPKLRTMVSNLMSDLRSQGNWFTSSRDIAQFRKQINQIEHYMLNNHPELFYSKGTNGETTDLLQYLNAKDPKNKSPLDKIPDIHTALNKEMDLVNSSLKPGQVRKFLQKWVQ